MPRAPILVVEDDAQAAGIMRMYLEHDGFAVEPVTDGKLALARALRDPRPRLVVLDLMLPGLDGFAVCQALRADSDVPIIVVTARVSEEDRLRGLELGADDYVTKPFSPRELVARVRAVLRRVPAEEPSGPVVERGGVRIDPARHAVTVDGRAVALTPREFRLLFTLLRSPGRVWTRDELAQRALGDAFDGLERTIDVHVKNLRHKIEADPAHPVRVVTVHGVGYRFAAEA